MIVLPRSSPIRERLSGINGGSRSRMLFAATRNVIRLSMSKLIARSIQLYDPTPGYWSRRALASCAGIPVSAGARRKCHDTFGETIPM